MNVFAEGLIKYDRNVKVRGVHNIGFNPPLPHGSYLKMSRCYLRNDEQPTLETFKKLKYELFNNIKFSYFKSGIFVHVLAAPSILIPEGDGYIKARKLYLHLVPENLFHLIEQKNEYEWWQNV